MTAEEFNMQKSLIDGTLEADTVARFAYEIIKQRFLTGNVNVTQLNAVQRQSIDARRNFINVLENYWRYYYTHQ